MESTAAEDEPQWVHWTLEQAGEMLTHRGTTAAGCRHIYAKMSLIMADKPSKERGMWETAMALGRKNETAKDRARERLAEAAKTKHGVCIVHAGSRRRQDGGPEEHRIPI